MVRKQATIMSAIIMRLHKKIQELRRIKPIDELTTNDTLTQSDADQGDEQEEKLAELIKKAL